MSETRLEFAISTIAHDSYIDFPRALSQVQSKNVGSTNRSGDLLTFVCDFEFITSGSTELTVYTAKENWVTKNAFKKWHALRDFMFKQSGLSKKERGRYSAMMRPAFDPIHSGYFANGAYDLNPQEESFDASGDVSEWEWSDASAMTGGDWGGQAGGDVPTQIVVEANPDSPDTALETDQFALHICGPSVNNTTGIMSSDQNWDSVGMIASYMADRAHPSSEPDVPVDYRSNPLALLKGRSESTYETVAIAHAEALLDPPYDTTSTGDMQNPVMAGFLLTTAAGQQITRAYGVRIPAGICMITASAVCDFRVIVRKIELSRG